MKDFLDGFNFQEACLRRSQTCFEQGREMERRYATDIDI